MRAITCSPVPGQFHLTFLLSQSLFLLFPSLPSYCVLVYLTPSQVSSHFHHSIFHNQHHAQATPQHPSFLPLTQTWYNQTQCSMVPQKGPCSTMPRQLLLHHFLLQSITMPIKNFFLSLLLAPTHSSYYPLPCYPTGTSLNCISRTPSWNPPTGTLLNCISQTPSQNPSSSTTLNCNLAQTMHDMPSSHVGHLGHLRLLRHLGHWMYSSMPSSPYVVLRHLRQLRHPSHLSHLGHLGNIGDLDTLNPNPLNPAPTDSQLEAFITELDPMDPGLSEGYYKDNSLNPIPTDTPLITTMP
jgi:hypothetical protein